MKSISFQTREAWRAWLQANHDKEDGIWMVFYKQNDQPVIDYESAVEEALCFGWIDSIIKKIDERKYARKFTPRKQSSKWSELNKRRVERLISKGKMTEIGMTKVNAAKKSGMWNKSARPDLSFDLPASFRQALQKNPDAEEFFQKLAPSYQKQYIAWIKIAKRQETVEKRIAESIRLLKQGEKLGLK
jgi:uncharacterized protein YdeI (YjbR/CyaY-like superfamily)